MTLGRLMDTGRALTIRRPWIAAQVLHGRGYEIRSRPPPADLINRRFWLHCAKALDAADRADVLMLEQAGLDTAAAAAWPGHLVGRATLQGFVHLQLAPAGSPTLPARLYRARTAAAASWATREVARSRWLNALAPTRYRPDPAFVWRLVVEPIEPVGPLRGQLGLWGVPSKIHSAALEAVMVRRRRVLEDLLEPAAWELGDLRRDKTALEVGRPGGRRVRVDPARLMLEVDDGGQNVRHHDIEGFDELVRRLTRHLTSWGLRPDRGVDA